MVGIESSVRWNGKTLERFKAAARVNSVAVGYPDDAVYPDGTSVKEVALVQEFGTPKILPRPWIRPTIASKKGHWFRKISEGLHICRDERSLKAMWESRGKAMVVNLQNAIDEVVNPPLSENSLMIRKARKIDSKKPLVCTGKMKYCLSYRVAGGEWKK